MISPDSIRNFCIIAHIDHGKSTLCDRFLELTGQIKRGQSVERVLDSNPISKERGITIKLAPVSMSYNYKHKHYLLNMIDTPGHVDFHYEVSRSLAACEGAILVVDATQGIQAQTLAYWQRAREQGLKIVGAVNKIDLPTAQTKTVLSSMLKHFAMGQEDICLISAKSGEGVEKLLEKVLEKIPSPEKADALELQALVFDSFYHPYKGVVVYLRVKQGSLKNKLDKLKFLMSKAVFKGIEIGKFEPQLKKVDDLGEGEVGYLATGLKDIKLAQVGDTLTANKEEAMALPGYKKPKPMVYLNFFPVDVKQFELLRDALDKLKLNDASLIFSQVYSEALGKGFRCGFLGLLHAEIIQERIEREYNLNLVATQPSVVYKLEDQKSEIYSAAELSPGKNTVYEPITRATIFTPTEYIGNVFKLCEEKRGQFLNMEHFALQVKLEYMLPLSEIIVDFFDKLKSVTSGYASFDYRLSEYRLLKAVRLDVLIHHQQLPALSQIVTEDKAYKIGREMVGSLKRVTPRQMFEFSIQAAIAGKIIASEKIKAFRKDVTAKLYGGDQTRKDKLLKKQAKGKKRLKKIGKVELPQEAFMAVLKRG